MPLDEGNLEVSYETSASIFITSEVNRTSVATGILPHQQEQSDCNLDVFFLLYHCGTRMPLTVLWVGKAGPELAHNRPNPANQRPDLLRPWGFVVGG